ncbi:hypothetical protein FNV43_RR04857 [Rhamnella rubrinervis]|uniref:Piezo non-specific cation channel R-Ras-binding domain-containing protein n=1 Tax=Rhamnella rubrinervis TaxID=2594499 RepID=A0A8K0HMM0_9ROSA|nr:hypothetical protein FNV43_RR04857 [Rhamnella rubrinervis]
MLRRQRRGCDGEVPYWISIAYAAFDWQNIPGIYVDFVLTLSTVAAFDAGDDLWGRAASINIIVGWFCRAHSSISAPVVNFLLIQVVAACVALMEMYGNPFGLDSWTDSCYGHIYTSIEHIGSHLRALCCLLLPALQLVVGISHPSWTSIPFFICSSIGLVDWSLTSNLLGLFRWWRYLLLYAGFNIILLYVCQLPIEFSDKLLRIADFIGLFRISAKSEWSEVCSAVSLLLFYVMISLLALSFWSFHFASLCAFGLVAYVGYILYAFPSMLHLHRLNGLLLVFILFWAASTYVFNVASTVFHNKLHRDMEIWETIGLWHYQIPGFYLLAQFGLGVLVALGNLVNNSVFLYLSDQDGPSTNDSSTVEGKEETIVFVVATIAYGLRKSSRAIMLALTFLMATKPGFIHAVYSLLNKTSAGDFLEMALLACFCSIHNHGFDMLSSFSAIVQRAHCPPLGFRTLRAGLIKSVLLSVYSSRSTEKQQITSSRERMITSYLSAIGQKFLSIYRSCGTYIASLTILLTVYLVTPNYTSFGYLFFLLVWLIGRQIHGKTRRRLWYPLKVYAVAVLVFIYSISVFINFRTWLSRMIDLDSAFGYNQEDSILKNVWESLAVIIVMQLFSYERRQSKSFKVDDCDAPEIRAFSFIKRLLIWHSEKILILALFYASLSPISAFGFLYLLGLVICSMLPKTSRIPSTLFLIYSGILAVIEYLFQMWGDKAEMFPGQKYSSLSLFLGLQLYESGFSGLEAGLRRKVLVIAACILQYNVFHWLEKMLCDSRNREKFNEPCTLFDLAEAAPNETESKSSMGSSSLAEKQGCSSLNSGLSQGLGTLSSDRGCSDGGDTSKYLYFYFWESSRESRKWNRKRIFFLRKERLDMQKATLKLYMKFWIENMFNLFGLEINMVALLLASFTVLNAFSLLYIASLAACVLLHRPIIQKLWPLFVFLFASIVTLEYLALWLNQASWQQHKSHEARVLCHDCWRVSDVYFNHCLKCWLGIIVDDSRMLISYYAVFMFSCFKLRADRLFSLCGSKTYQKLISQCKKASVLSDLSFETKAFWTFLDYLRLYSYCHLLHLVLALILITGTLEYDILHLGYLGFALIFFRMRLEILKKKNKIFMFLRMYNFALIVLSLAYQSPFIGEVTEGKCETLDYFSEVIGFYKYDYGFRITSRSALVEIIIFMLVSMQSCMFSSKEFDYVSQYLEAEQIGAIVREQEKRAAWKTAQLQRIRKSEEQKCLRNLQVENMKSEMLNLKVQLDSMSTSVKCGKSSTESEGLKRERKYSLDSHRSNNVLVNGEAIKRRSLSLNTDAMFAFDMIESPTSEGTASSLEAVSAKPSLVTLHGITELGLKVHNNEFLGSDGNGKGKRQGKKNPIISAVHLIGNGVSHVQSLGNKAVNNLINFLNIEKEELDLSDNSSEDDEVYYEIESQNTGNEHAEQTVPNHSGFERTLSEATYSEIGTIFRYMWGQMRSNNDVVCYCCFLLIFIWNFSLLSMVYLVALFLYALCINTGPSYMFWVVMLIYTEACILLQYVYQIIIQHCGFAINMSFLQELGFPAHKIMSSFVISNLPLFLVYLFTLLQTSITTRDGDWGSVTEFIFQKRKDNFQQDEVKSYSYSDRIQRLILPVRNIMKLFSRSMFRYWKSLTQGAETPPYFVQLSMEVTSWPKDGIQPERIESGINRLLRVLHSRRCKDKNVNQFQSPSRVRVQSIERSPENCNIALAVFEVAYASLLTECSPEEWFKSLTPASDVANEIRKAQRDGILKEIRFPYPILSVIGGGKREIDLYAYIFCADLAVFFLVAIFYQSVIKNNSEFLEVYQLEDQFPEEFVFILMAIFFLIVLDRIIYLCSFATGKVIFYIFNLILFTLMVTRYAWYMVPSQRYAGRLALRAIYLTKAISLALQAIQIRFGMPHKSTLYRQFLTSSVSKINYMGFRIYRALPFLYELRCVLDWSCTTTSLTMYDWLKLEDIHASLFLVKCDVDLNRVGHQQGQKQTKMTKFCNGICLFFILMCVIWAPMLMYSSGNPTNIANPIKDASVRIDIKTVSGRLTLFETTLCEKISWDELDARIDLDPKGHLTTYNEKDIQLICCQADSSALWLVPPVVQARYIKSLRWRMDIVFAWQFIRDRPKGKEVVKYELSVQDKDLPQSSRVMEVLNGTANSFTIYNVYPRYFRVTGSGDVRFLENAVEMVSGDVVLNRGNPEWWSFHDTDASDVSGCGELAGPLAIVVSEETPQGILGETLSKFSIWGLYITFVLAVGRFIRLQCSDLRMRIPFENLPSCDRLLAICEDIYAARAEGELEVEEVLYWTLVKIYRSPHMLLQYTKLD